MDFKCENCGKSFDEEIKLRGHKMTCKQKQEERSERVPFHQQTRKRGYEKDPGFVYYRFNDNWTHDPDRVQKAMAAGYEVVGTEETGKNVGTNESGSEIKGVLMKIPKELYDEDQAKKLEAGMFIDRQVQRGKFNESENDSRYVPNSGIKIENKLTP